LIKLLSFDIIKAQKSGQKGDRTLKVFNSVKYHYMTILSNQRSKKTAKISGVLRIAPWAGQH